MSFMKTSRRLLASACIAALVTPLAAMAGTYSVSVGYADGLRGSGFFPSPWSGDAGVTFLGTTAPHDAGAIMIRNTGGAPMVVDSVDVSINGTLLGDIWLASFPFTLAAGGILILTETAHYNFDTSDIHLIVGSADPCDGIGSDPAVCASTFPTVTIGVDGGAATLFGDTGHVLDTEGFDYASVGNESFAWRPIGGAAGPAGIPEPASLALVGLGLAVAGLAWRRKA